MGEDCKAKIEVVLNNEDHVEMYLNGKTHYPAEYGNQRDDADHRTGRGQLG